jgi:uncharacterized protein YndB with AHSA1/START domain
LAHDSFSVSDVIPAAPERIYSAWLDPVSHSSFTGEEATVEPFVGGRHTSFGGYSEGTNLELLPGRRIVQSWRAKDFPEGSPDSRLEVTLEETLGGTVVTIMHSELPSGQSERYRDGWVKFYLEPLKQFFSAEGEAEEAAAAEDEEPEEDTVTERPAPVETVAAAPKPVRARRPVKAAAKVAARRPAKAAGKKAARRAAKPASKVSAARRAAAPKGAKARGKAKPAKKTARPAKKRPAKRKGRK